MTSPTITPINIGSLRFDLAAIYRLAADHPAHGRIVQVPMQGYHISLPGRSVLFDAPAFDPAYIGDMLIPDFSPPDGLMAQLAANGIDPAGVTDVVISHLHFDHFSGLTREEDGRYIPNFPNARHYLGAGDWQPDDFGRLTSRTVVIINNEGLLELVDSPTKLGDGLAIRPLSGETPGHQILSFDHGSRRTYFTGDLYHHELEFEFPELDVNWAGPETMPRSKRRFLEEAAAVNNHVYFAHIAGPCSVSAENGQFSWQPAA